MSGRTHHQQIRAVKGWTIEEFNGGAHIRINGVIDVWPDVFKYMPSRSAQKAKHYADLHQLKSLVKTAEQQKQKQDKKPTAIAEVAPKRPVVQMTQEEWKQRFA